MKLTIQNYKKIVGANLVAGWKRTDVHESDACYEFKCEYVIGYNNMMPRYLRLERKSLYMTDKFCWQHALNRSVDMKMLSTWTMAVNELGHELIRLLNTTAI